jgi:hypothetical protein
MSRVEAYRCDNCQSIVEVDECVGISLQPDLFEKMKGFPVVYKCEKADVHLCTTCYNMQVVSVAERETNRRKDERGYRLKLEELAYSLREQAVSKFTRSKREKSHRK